MTFWNWVLSFFRRNAGISEPTVKPAPVPASPITVTPVKPVETPKPVDTHTILKGIDAYHGDTKDWTKYKPDFLSAKATQGTQHVDSSFQANRAKAKATGIPFQAYHFAEPGNALAQAKHFCDVVGSLEVGDLPPCFDWEESSAGMASPVDAALWLKYVHFTLGITPMIYGGLSKLSELKLQEEFSEFPFWFARPGHSITNPGPLPPPWKSCLFLQNAFGEDGGEGGFDWDQFLGTKEDLKKWTKQ